MASDELRRRLEALADAWEGKGESWWRQLRRHIAHDYDGYLYAAALRRVLAETKEE